MMESICRELDAVRSKLSQASLHGAWGSSDSFESSTFDKLMAVHRDHLHITNATGLSPLFSFSRSPKHELDV